MKLFADHDIGSKVVVDLQTGEQSGIVTEADILQQVAARADIDSVPVAIVLNSLLVTIASTGDIQTAAMLITEHSIRRLPVIDDGDLVGIITTTDLTYYLLRLRNKILR